jgi:hypothetical protein
MRLVQHRRLLVLLLAQALTSAVAAHDDVRRVAVGETLRRSGYESTSRRAQRSRLYPRNAGYIQQLPTGSRFRPRYPRNAGYIQQLLTRSGFQPRIPYPSRDSYENGDCPAGVRRTVVCVKVTDDRDGDPFVGPLLEGPSKKTILLLDRLGIPAIKDVPPIVIINPHRGTLQVDVFGLP